MIKLWTQHYNILSIYNIYISSAYSDAPISFAVLSYVLAHAVQMKQTWEFVSIERYLSKLNQS